MIEDLADLPIGGKLYPEIDEYGGVDKFEVKPLKALFYIKALFGFLLYSAMIFIMVALIEKKRAKTKKEE